MKRLFRECGEWRGKQGTRVYALQTQGNVESRLWDRIDKLCANAGFAAPLQPPASARNLFAPVGYVANPPRSWPSAASWEAHSTHQLNPRLSLWLIA
jgi:hypothetical protein